MKSSLKFFTLNLFIAFLINTVFSSISVAQDMGHLEVLGQIQNDKTRKGLEGATIKIYKGLELVDEVLTSNSGKFILNIDYQAMYILEFTKTGYGTKKIKIDTKIPLEIQDIILQNKI